MKGEIKCISTIGKGTLFEFYINVGCQDEDKGLSENEHFKF